MIHKDHQKYAGVTNAATASMQQLVNFFMLRCHPDQQASAHLLYKRIPQEYHHHNKNTTQYQGVTCVLGSISYGQDQAEEAQVNWVILIQVGDHQHLAEKEPTALTR